MKFNLGCGHIHKGDYVNVDIQMPADVICNIGSEHLPYDEGCAQRVEADNLMEHFDNDEFMFAMNEVFRVLRRGGVFWWKVPDAQQWPDGAYGDPTHKRFFFPRSFRYVDCAMDQWKNYGRHYGFHGWNLQELSTDGRFFTCVLTKP